MLLLVAAAAGGYYYYHSSRETSAAPAATSKSGAPPGKGGDAATRKTPVVVMPVERGSIDIYLNGLGTVTPLATVTVKSRVDGQLMRVLFNEGQLVKRGEVLAEIDPRPFQVQLTQAEGQRARDQALLQNARLDLERYKTLFEQDSIARQQFDTQGSLVQQYEAALKVDQGAIDNARLQLTYARVTAPISGRVGLRQVDPGNIVRAADSSGIVVVTQLEPISVVFTLPQDQLPPVLKRWQAGERLPVEAYDRERKAKLASGVLQTIDNQIDVTTGTVKLKAQFANDDGALFPNQFVNVRLLADTRPDQTLVPTSALQRGTQGTFVYVVKDDSTVALRTLTLGPSEGERAIVERGVRPGDLVVVDGADRLREGARVEAVSRDSRAVPTDEKRPRRGGGKGGERRKRQE